MKLKTTMPIPDFPSIGLRTERLILSGAGTSDASDLLSYYSENRHHLEPWNPLRCENFYTLTEMDKRLCDMERQMRAGNALHILMRRFEGAPLVGECSFTNIVRGPFQACHLGFSVAASQEGNGLMYEALSRAIEFVFDVYGLHRVMANYKPENSRSGRLLDRLGFEMEGRARAYLKINGQWADHILTSRISTRD
ncbi:GNAT family N-acetyltransferase [Burkholderia vietnamiensis]|uniref:GNAT family N-acetyltransferase n=1 Tax=Burkholderia vietnamiensis TaxID=60552 RepID=UPI002012289F|nr:GNAT family N-acetyltransferase [Burkholderia vietnamiensis]